MIYMLRGLFDFIGEFARPQVRPQPLPAGQWWFNTQRPVEWEPVLATAAETHDDGDDEEPMPPYTGSNRPKCKSCGGPNFSPKGKLCLACRLGIG